MDRDSRSWTINREIPYPQWIADRVKKVKLPFRLDSSSLINEEQRPDTDSEEVKRLKEEIERLKRTNAKVVDDFQSLRHNFVDLKKDYEEKTKVYEELSMRAQERDIASSAESQWKSLYEDIKREKTRGIEKVA